MFSFFPIESAALKGKISAQVLFRPLIRVELSGGFRCLRVEAKADHRAERQEQQLNLATTRR
jgi:hypothetical protein